MLGHRHSSATNVPARDLAAPDLVDVETAAVLRKRWLARFISVERFDAAAMDLRRLDFERVPTL